MAGVGLDQLLVDGVKALLLWAEGLRLRGGAQPADNQGEGENRADQ
jgi:hypothetical protein